jgi:proteasome accessory factor A
MSVHRVMGIETEYGISHPGHPGANPMRLSALVVNSYASLLPPGLRLAQRWDYNEESPLRDARGYDASPPDTDAGGGGDDSATANLVLTNGARLYVDHAHPEYSAPEATNPADAVLWDRAGMVIMDRAATRAEQVAGHPMRLYKNNTDGKGASYGTHENYLMSRRTPFPRIVRGLLPFFATRAVYAGAGRVGLGVDSREPGFQISSRADFFETEVGLETTLKRPIVNSRDEPHADPARHRRLHVIVGDANLSEWATFLKLGATALVLGLIEADGIPGWLELACPVRTIREVSHDLTLRATHELRDGRRLRALDIQQAYLDAAAEHVERGEHRADPQTNLVLQTWQEMLDGLARDPLSCRAKVDWVAKLALLNGYRERDGLAWDHPRLALVDLQYSDVRPAAGLAARMEARGTLARMTSAADVERAVSEPPHDTRAWFRGQCIRRYPGAVAAASWDSVVLDVPGRAALVRIPTTDPVRGTRAHVDALLERAADVTSLVSALGDQRH